MAPLKRWLGRLLGFAVLVAAGWFAFDYARTRPRCVIVSDAHAIHFSDDGNTLITGYTGCQIGNRRQGGKGKPPVKVWDTRTGRVARTVLDDVAPFKSFSILAPRGLLAATYAEANVRLANWESGQEWSIDVGGEAEQFWFSPCGGWLAVRLAKPKRSLVLIDLRRREIAQRVSGDAVGWGFEADGSRWLYIADGRVYAWNTEKRDVEASIDVGPMRISGDEPYFAFRSANDLSFVICDRLTLKPVSRVRPDFRPAGPAAWDAFQNCEAWFSAKGQYVATLVHGGHKVPGVLEIWDTKTGRRLAAFPELQRGWGWFLDERLFVCFHPSPSATSQTFTDSVAAVDVASGKLLWKRPGELGQFFTFDMATGIQIDLDGTWQFFDPATGELQSSLPHPFGGDRLMPSFDDAKRLVYAVGRRRSLDLPASWKERLARWIPTESGCVQIVDVKDRQVVRTLNMGVDDVAALCADGSTLVCVEFSLGAGASPVYHFRFYDVYSNKPWLWASAAPAGIMIVWLLWRTRRGRRSNATTPAATVGPGPSRGEPAA